MRWLPPRPVLVAGLVLSAVMGFQGSFTWASYLAVAGVTVLVVWLGVVRPLPRRPAPARLPNVALVAYAVPVLAFSLLEIVDDLLGADAAHPTLSSIFDPVFEIPALRALGWALWLWAGWELLRR